MKTRSGVALLALAVVTLIAASALADSMTTIYETDFSSDPGWTTNTPSHYYWDSGQGTYYMKRINNANEYTYKALSGLSSAVPLRLEFDVNEVSANWAAGTRLVFWDSDMEVTSGTYFGVSFDQTDQGYHPYLVYSVTGQVGENQGMIGSSSYSLGTWYHTVVEWDPVARNLYAAVSNKVTGELLGERTLSVSGEFLNIDRIACSGINHTYAAGATGIGYYDNVNVSTGVVPEPFSMAFMGSAFVGVVGYGLRRWRKAKSTAGQALGSVRARG